MLNGFSLPEVLIALILITTTTLILFKTQWQLKQQLLHQIGRAEQVFIKENESERQWKK